MASLWKHPKSKYWTACFTDANGKQRKRSTKETNRAKAIKIAIAYESAARTTRTAQQVRRVIADLHKDITGESLEESSVRIFIERFLSAKEREVANSTMVFYRSATKRFLDFLGNKADRPITDIRKQSIIDFRNSEAKQVAAKTANHRLKCIKMVFRSAREDGMILDDPTEFVKTVKQEAKAEKRIFTIEELRKALAAANKEWQSMIMFGLYTGQRLSDVALMRWSNIDLSKNSIILRTRKTGRKQQIPIASPLLTHIKSLPDPPSNTAALHEQAFAKVEAEDKTGSLSRQFGEILAKAGLREKRSHRKADREKMVEQPEQSQLSFHCLRHTATTWLHEAGVPAAVAQELIGHDSAQMHEIYVNVGAKAMEKAIKSMPSLQPETVTP